jgi:alpha-methylacyl-CoA racemase
MAGPLTGLRIVEMAGIGPGPFAAMMLADHGAEVIRIERPWSSSDSDAALGRSDASDPVMRSRVVLEFDLKAPDDLAKLRALVQTADGLIEGYRPGVMERLGLGPDVLLADNPSLIYGRMTGWGQTGPMAPVAGHDINYIALAGVLGAMGRAGAPPVPPLNLVGDYGGGGMLLAFGMVAALLAVRNGGKGQVIDCAIADGSALLMAKMWGARTRGGWQERRGSNLIDSGAPFYDAYETADGQFVAIGAIEAKFYTVLRDRLGVADDPELDIRDDRSLWPRQKAKLAAVVRRHTRAELCEIFDGFDACLSPVLTLSECLEHPQNVARGTFLTVNGVSQPAPAPRYSVTLCSQPMEACRPQTDEWLKAQGIPLPN